MALGETGDWAGATDRIVSMIMGNSDPLEGALPEGYGSQRLLEAFAREFEAEHGMELGMSFPALAAGFNGAMQGGFLAPMPKTETVAGQTRVTGMVWTPTVIQFIGIAEAGQMKSTLLAEVTEPLKRALDREAAEHRRHIVEAWKKDAMDGFAHTGLKVDGGDGAWEKVYNGGLCPSSLTDQGTPEGIRNNIVRHGGHRVILTAEPDVLAEINQYQNKGTGGSIGLLLRGWGQEDLAVDRAGTDALYVREPSLPYVIMLQPESFVKHTGGGGGHDDFVDRGLFSRVWLWESRGAGTEDALADADWELADLDFAGLAGDGAALPASMLSVLREKLADRMCAVALRTDSYRVSKGLEQAWRESKVLWMPRPKEVHRERLELDGPDGLRTAVKVQKMRLALRRAVAMRNAEREGTRVLLDPLAVRFTTHVMRWAVTLTLADDPEAKTVDTAHVEDVATRIMPWLWSGWMQVMGGRMEANAAEALEEGTLKNPKGIDLSASGVILRALAKLTGADGPAAMSGFLPMQIFRKGRSALKGKVATSGAMTDLLHKELARAVADGLVEVLPTGETDATGKPTQRYRLAPGVLSKIMSDGA